MNYIYSKSMYILSQLTAPSKLGFLNVRKAVIISFLLWFSISCSGKKELSKAGKLISNSDIATIDSLMFQESWSVPGGPKKLMPVRTWDLKHQKIEVRFDFENQIVIGKTHLFFTSMKDHNDSLAIDAKQLKIQAVYHPDTSTQEPISHRQDSTHLYLSFTEKFSRGDSLFVAISYRTKPLGNAPNTGKSIYFVDPTQQNPHKKTQVWATGVPWGNSHWLPTIDHPAERATQETWISVPDSMETLSNGRIIESRKWAGDSLTTHFWLMDKPYPPYLFSLAAGDYKISKALDANIVYRFYTHPTFESNRERIYEPTKQAGRFLQNYLNTTYPWTTYSQAPVYDMPFRGTSGGTVSLLNNNSQFDERAAGDIDNADLIVHLFTQQWIGNLVTPANWANIALSKGMASYFEVLFRNHYQDDMAADWHSLQQKIRYLNEADQLRRPIIFDQYHNPVDMFDAHSFDKMSRVLRMLHHYVGDSVWRTALEVFLQEYAYESVTYQDLQEIFERQSGENLDWFFQQWLLEPGHPTVRIEPDTLNGRNHLRIIQMQDMDKQPVYRFPLDLAFTYGQKIQSQTVWVDKVDSTYQLSVDPNWSDLIADPRDIILAEFNQRVEKDQYIERLYHSSVSVRYQAVQKLNAVPWDSALTEEIKKVATDDPWWGLRRTAMASLVAHKTTGLVPFARTITPQTEKEGRVRIHALYMVKDDTTNATRRYLETVLNDPSYFVAAEAISLFGMKYPEDSFEVLKKFKAQESYRDVIKAAFAQAMQYSEHPKAAEALLEMAQANGTAQYIADALQSLFVRYQTGEPTPTDTEKRELLQICYDKLSSEMSGQTTICLRIIEDLADETQAANLKRLLQQENLSEAVVEDLQTIINHITPESETETETENKTPIN